MPAAATRGCTVWFTGLPCSGKSTLARMTFEKLSGLGLPVEILDGDEIRKHFSAGVGFSKEERSAHLRRVSYLCQMLTKHGVIVIAAFISPYRENRAYARGLIGDRFVEIFTDSSVEVCVKRDIKGMYKRAIAGEIKQFTGISDPYERPERPELVLKTAAETAEQSLAKLMNLLRDRYGIRVS